jgi:Ca-activated chloride channel family protein
MVRQAEYEFMFNRAAARYQPQHDSLWGRSIYAGEARGTSTVTLIRTQYPGDSLRLVLFHDSAEEVPLKQLRAGRCRALPHERARSAAGAAAVDGG